MPNESLKYRWTFFRAGGVDQVSLRQGADLRQLSQLDQKLWTALAMPTKGVELDARTIALLDADLDGRIRVPEIRAAVAWVCDVLHDPDEVFKGGDSLPLAAIRDESVLTGAHRVLQNLGKPEAETISLADVRDTDKFFSAANCNGDGIVPPETAGSEDKAQIVRDIIATVGSVNDRSGQPGIDQAKVDAFFDETAKYLEWLNLAETDASLLPLGEATAGAFEALTPVRAKIEDFFTRCRLAALDPRAALAVGGTEAEFLALAGKELSSATPELRQLPLAAVTANRGLPLRTLLNPAWLDEMAAFVAKAVDPLLGADHVALGEADWKTLQAKLVPYAAWLAAKPAVVVDKLGAERLRFLAGGGARQQMEELIRADLAVATEVAQVAAVEKLLLYQRDLRRILNNFVNFEDFYAKKDAVFQAGTLYLDGRGCALCLEVLDPAKHALMAGLSGMYLAYCDCTRPGGLKKQIVAAFTDGDSDNLLVGRNGVFYDRQGQDWDATIVRIVANPISLREAFWSPYKKLGRMIAEQVAKRAATAEAQSQTKLAGTAETAANADKAAKPVEAKKMDVGTVAAIGVAVGGIGAMVTGLASAFFGLGWWIPVALLGIVLVISGPAVILAYLKLRRRNLGPILDASGWAINGRARINVPFGAALTDLAVLPPGAKRMMSDPYAEKKRPWKLYIFLLVVLLLALAWYFGKLDPYLPLQLHCGNVLGSYAPASALPPPAPAPVPAPVPPPTP